MRFSTLVLTASTAAAAPFSFPLPNGFPNLNSTAMAQVFKLAGGTLPNVALPTSLSKAGTQALQLIAANEIFEVAYFTELLANVTNNVPGYDVQDKDYVVQTLTAVVNQEQVHATAANAVLANAKQTTINPCQYSFPVDNFDDAILLAQTFTDVVLGVLPVVQALFAADGGQEPALIPIIGSILAQEGEQTGYYRALQKKVAAAAPLLTGTTAQFIYTVVSQFIIPGGSCNVNVIGLTAFPALTVETVPKDVNSTQLFSVQGGISAANSTLVYISGQNLPVSVPISNVNIQGGKSYFFAPFPYESGFSRGLTVGALVGGANRKFNSTADVAAATLFGPALIEIN